MNWDTIQLTAEGSSKIIAQLKYQNALKLELSSSNLR